MIILLEVSDGDIRVWYWPAFALVVALGTINAWVIGKVPQASARKIVVLLAAWPLAFAVVTGVNDSSAIRIWLQNLMVSTMGMYSDVFLTFGALTLGAGLVGGLTALTLTWAVPASHAVLTTLMVGTFWALIVPVITYLALLLTYLAAHFIPPAVFLIPFLAGCAMGYTNSLFLIGVVKVAKGREQLER